MNLNPSGKTKILFVAHLMNIGGIEKSLLSLIDVLPPNRFDLHLQLTDLKGEFLEKVPAHVKVSAIEPYRQNLDAIERPGPWIVQQLKKFRFGEAFGAGFAAVRALLARSRGPYYDYFLRRGPLPREEYDVAVSYPGPSEMHDWYVARWVNARRKLGWIHFDIDYVFHRPATIRAAYSRFERVFIVDESSKKIFDRNYPDLSPKTTVLHNIVDSAEILTKGAEPGPEPLPEGVKRIVTVGRINKQKAQDIAVEAAAILKARGSRFVWHMIGSGLQYDEYSRLPEALSVADCVRFEGAALNPYPWMAAADIYVQPSRYEGYCITVAEARCFGKPIVATDFAGAAQLDGYPNHHICGHSAREIADAVAAAFDEKPSSVAMPRDTESERLIQFLTDDPSAI